MISAPIVTGSFSSAVLHARFAESAGFEEAVGDAQVRKASSSHRNFCSIHRGSDAYYIRLKVFWA